MAKQAYKWSKDLDRLKELLDDGFKVIVRVANPIGGEKLQMAEKRGNGSYFATTSVYSWEFLKDDTKPH